MSLSNEDALRLNVLTAQPVRAIRINESSMVLSALTDKGEATIDLSPTTGHDRYLREVRDFLSEKYLGMPGGYPRHLERWTRMGVSQNSLDKMLLLGEQEAIVAMAYSRDIDAELASYAWWACQSPEIARNLLKTPEVAASDLGVELAHFLLEFLPFEERPLNVVDSVRQCLQPGLISAQQSLELWERARRKNPYIVGFLLAGPEAIPLDESPHPRYEETRKLLNQTDTETNPVASHLLHFLSPPGRKWLNCLKLALKKPGEPDVVIALFIAIDRYIQIEIGAERGERTITQITDNARSWCSGNCAGATAELQPLLAQMDTHQRAQLTALLVLAQIGEHTLNEIFGGRDATGTVMRKHLKPLTELIQTSIEQLLK